MMRTRKDIRDQDGKKENPRVIHIISRPLSSCVRGELNPSLLTEGVLARVADVQEVVLVPVEQHINDDD